MKTFLLATAAVTLAGTAAWALDDDNRQMRVRLAGDHAMTWNPGGTVIEIRGEDGERTIHMQGSGSDASLNVNGQDIRIRGGQVTIDGQAVETDGAAVIIIDGDEIRIVNNGDADRFDGRFAMHMAERAEHFARMAGEMENFRFDFDSEGLQADVMASLEAALAGLEDGVRLDDGARDWEDMTEAERESVRASVEVARQEIREAMEEMRLEMREAHRSGANEMRRVHVELGHARREAARAGRDEARVGRDAARAERDAGRAERDAARAEREEARAETHRMRWELAVDDTGRAERSIRIERDDDGRRQVWVDGEEQTGDDLVSWLNQIEAERLAGGVAEDRGRHERRIIRLDREAGTNREIDLTGRRVIVLRNSDAEDGEHVFEFEDADGEK